MLGGLRNITVAPVIGIIWDKRAFNPVPNAAEVESIFDAPLEMFLKDENKSYVIWALTAGILIKAASVVYQQPPAFEERRPTFWNRSSD
ncbi:UNVERIFIED_CONTAM: Nudix hydrolase 11 [Sesamum calycinum]|uniref:Nudix hydrolase 11 n=1 Tax=Sesamum calycinum TaxID=2727403 RepID=A0AAW2JMB6_9LAMI